MPWQLLGRSKLSVCSLTPHSFLLCIAIRLPPLSPFPPSPKHRVCALRLLGAGASDGVVPDPRAAVPSRSVPAAVGAAPLAPARRGPHKARDASGDAGKGAEHGPKGLGMRSSWLRGCHQACSAYIFVFLSRFSFFDEKKRRSHVRYFFKRRPLRVFSLGDWTDPSFCGAAQVAAWEAAVAAAPWDVVLRAKLAYFAKRKWRPLFLFQAATASRLQKWF